MNRSKYSSVALSLALVGIFGCAVSFHVKPALADAKAWEQLLKDAEAAVKEKNFEHLKMKFFLIVQIFLKVKNFSSPLIKL